MKTMRISENKCTDCKWNNLFWAESGCAKRNVMEPCEFEPNGAKNDDQEESN